MNDCIKAEMEYREWRECPLWYCVKTLLRADGKMESEIVSDEKTKIPIAIQSLEKPQDGVFEPRAYRQMRQTFSVICNSYSTTASRRLFLCLKSYWHRNNLSPRDVSR